MKMILTTLASLSLAISAYAANRSSSWSEIFKSSAVVQTHYQLGGLQLSNACLTDTEVRSIHPVKTCTDLRQVKKNSGDGDVHIEYVCHNWETRDVATPRSYEEPVCTRYTPSHRDGPGPECIAYGMKSHWIPETIEATVTLSHGDGHETFTKSFTFPMCQ